MKALALTAIEATFVNKYQQANNFSLMALGNEETAAFYSLKEKGGIITKDSKKAWYEVADAAIEGLENCFFIGK